MSFLQQNDYPQPSPTPVVPDVATLGWEPVLNETFDSELDETIWHVHEGRGVTGPGMYTRDAVRIEDGDLTITTYSEEDSNGDLQHYTGEVRAGWGPNWAGFMSTYGYIEARVKLNNPPTTRSAFWMLSPTWHHAPLQDPAAAGPEIDIFEEVHPSWDKRCPGKDVISLPCDEIAAGTLHWNGFEENHTRTPQRAQWDSPSPQGSYLTYGLLWTPDGYWMFRNGRQTYHSTEAITYSPEYLILSQTSFADEYENDGSEPWSPDRRHLARPRSLRSP